MDDVEARQVIVRLAGETFIVTVEPPPPDASFDRTFATYREARGYAGGLRMVRGWRVHDEARA